MTKAQQAVQEERERCALIAERAAFAPGTKVGIRQRWVQLEIARLIRKGDPADYLRCVCKDQDLVSDAEMPRAWCKSCGRPVRALFVHATDIAPFCQCKSPTCASCQKPVGKPL